jgi:hypothetical protein
MFPEKSMGVTRDVLQDVGLFRDSLTLTQEA